MDDLKSIVSGLCKSPYLDEWILKLKDNEILFSPNKNIKPCIRIDEKYVKSDYWIGLDLLEAYSKSSLSNGFVDAFIINLINEAIEIYKNDKEIDPYKKLNSSHLILAVLFEICVQRKEYFDSIDVVSLISFSLSSTTAWPFSIVHNLFEHKNVLLKCSPIKVFEAYKTILDYGGKSLDYAEYLIIDDLIKQIPFKYYDYCKCKISTYDFSISSMGSFFEYEGEYEKEKESIIFNIFKTASHGIDAKTLKEDVEKYIFSKRKLLKRIGLCLININFEAVGDIFFDHIEVFFDDDDFYSDLRCLLDNNVKNIINQKQREMICLNVKNATFGIKEERAKIIQPLRNYLAKICSQNGLEIPFAEPSKQDVEFILNYNKSFYIVNHDFKGDVEMIKNKISNVSVDNSTIIYFDLIKGSSYFRDTVRQAFIETYFFDENNLGSIKLFDYSLATSLIHYHEQKKNTECLYNSIIEVLGICKSDNEYTNCLSTILFAIHSNIESFGFERFCHLLKQINYKWMRVDEFKYPNEIISECINEDIHSYLEMFAYAVEKGGMKADSLKTILSYYSVKFNAPKIKALMAFAFPKLLRIDKQYALELKNNIFNNQFNGTNPSYTMLAISHGYSFQLLEAISNQETLRKYLEINNGTNDEMMAQKVLFNWFLGGYLFRSSYEDIINIAFETKRSDAILENIRSINYWIEKNQITTQPELIKYFEKLNAAIGDWINKDFERDQLIRELSKFIVLTDGEIETSWTVLIKLFVYFDHYFSDECYELIEKFKNTRKDLIAQILDKYFSSYEQFKTYEKIMKKVFALVRNDDMYKEQSKKWMVSILNKNPDFDFNSAD